MQLNAIGDVTIVTITGLRFDGANVVFRQGTREFVVAPGTDQRHVDRHRAFPRDMVVGLTDIIVRHSIYGSSKPARLAPSGGLGGRRGHGSGASFFERGRGG